MSRHFSRMSARVIFWTALPSWSSSATGRLLRASSMAVIAAICASIAKTWPTASCRSDMTMGSGVGGQPVGDGDRLAYGGLKFGDADPLMHPATGRQGVTLDQPVECLQASTDAGSAHRAAHLGNAEAPDGRRFDGRKVGLGIHMVIVQSLSTKIVGAPYDVKNIRKYVLCVFIQVHTVLLGIIRYIFGDIQRHP